MVEKFKPEMDACVGRSSQHQPCRHVRYSFRNVENRYDGFSWAYIIEAIIELYLEVDKGECLAMPDLFDRLVHSLKDHFDNFCKKIEASNPLTEARDLKMSDGKRRRMDEDFRDALGNLVDRDEVTAKPDRPIPSRPL